MNMRLNASFYVVLAVTTLAFTAISCGVGKPSYANTPEGVTRKLFDSLQENDANKYLDSITPNDRQQPGLFFYRQLIQGIFGAMGMGQLEASKLKISFTDMTFKEVYNDGQIAQVQVSGKLRDLNLALEQDFSTVVNVVQIDGTWLISLSGEAEAEILATATPTNVPVDQKIAEQPTAAEQIAAAENLDLYLTNELSVVYRNARFETTNNDGTFATVIMTFEAWAEEYQRWLEATASVQLRYIGGKWVADEESRQADLTPKGRATADAIQAATQEAYAASAASTQQAVQANLGGTLVYVLDGGKQITIRRPDGDESTVLPLSDKYSDAKYESLELTPSGDGFYYSADTDWVKPAIFFSNLEGGDSVLLMQFGGQTFVKGISVSPDNSKLAVAIGSFVSEPNQIWIIPTNGGEGYPIWESREQDTSTASWSPDSNSLYIDVLSFNPTRGTIVSLRMDGSSQTIAELPPETVADDYFLINKLIAVSPDGKDLAFGGGFLGLLRISNGSKITLSETPFVCNPTWSQSGDRLIFASGNSIMVFNLTSGELTNPYNLPVSETHYSGCPLSFDWSP